MFRIKSPKEDNQTRSFAYRDNKVDDSNNIKVVV